ncbi:MAG: hypothetical protein Q8O40_18135 [Chloroflexota bacterium]|nr:hypothetical protein [Chloroflexota bacterium]
MTRAHRGPLGPLEPPGSKGLLVPLDLRGHRRAPARRELPGLREQRGWLGLQGLQECRACPVRLASQRAAWPEP